MQTAVRLSIWFQHWSKNVISFIPNQAGFVIYELLFQKCSWPEIWISCGKFPYLQIFILCWPWGEGFWHRKFWRILIQGCLFYFYFNVKMQFSPLTCCSFQISCNKGLCSHSFSFYGPCFLAEQQIHWELAGGLDWCWPLLKQNHLVLIFLMENWELKKKRYSGIFFSCEGTI